MVGTRLDLCVAISLWLQYLVPVRGLINSSSFERLERLAQLSEASLVWLRHFHVTIPQIAMMQSTQNNQHATRQVVLVHALASGVADSVILVAMSTIIEEIAQL